MYLITGLVTTNIHREESPRIVIETQWLFSMTAHGDYSPRPQQRESRIRMRVCMLEQIYNKSIYIEINIYIYLLYIQIEVLY